MEVTTFGMIGGLGALPPVVEKKAPTCELEELLRKISDLYPNLTQEKESLLVKLSGKLLHVGQVKVETQGKAELELALNHLFLANTVACHFNQTEKKEFQVRAFVWTSKTKSLTLAYKGISAAVNVEGYLGEGTVKLSQLVEQFKSIWQKAKQVRDMQEGFSADLTCHHSFQAQAPLQEGPFPKALFELMLCKC